MIHFHEFPAVLNARGLVRSASKQKLVSHFRPSTSFCYTTAILYPFYRPSYTLSKMGMKKTGRKASPREAKVKKGIAKPVIRKKRAGLAADIAIDLTGDENMAGSNTGMSRSSDATADPDSVEADIQNGRPQHSHQRRPVLQSSQILEQRPDQSEAKHPLPQTPRRTPQPHLPLHLPEIRPHRAALLQRSPPSPSQSQTSAQKSRTSSSPRTSSKQSSTQPSNPKRATPASPAPQTVATGTAPETSPSPPTAGFGPSTRASSRSAILASVLMRSADFRWEISS